jgi:hypothetical protein
VPACDVSGGLGHAAADDARLTYMLGWIVANAIVTARYHGSAIDVVPIHHPSTGWDRFLLTRRVSCLACKDEPADAFGLLLLDGDDAPRLALPTGETRLSLGRCLRVDPLAAVQRVLATVPQPELPVGDHSECWHMRAISYPALYSAVTDLILECRSFSAAREILVDDQQVDGAFHPLYLHTGARSALVTHDWFEISTDEYVAYVRIDGKQAIHFSDNGTWSTTSSPLAGENADVVRRRLQGLLRLARGAML